MKKLVSLICAVCLTAIAAHADKTVKFDFQTSEAMTMDVYPSTYIQPLVAEVVVDSRAGRIHDTWQLSPADFQARAFPGDDDATLANLRAYGLFKSSEKHNCDVIVAAMFDIRINNSGATIKLIGYPANFKNWKTGTAADYQWISIERGRVNPQAK